MITIIPLSKLILSDLNVRKTERDADIESLAADILARGLKQNLVVVAIDESDTFEVVAGGRRYQALQMLADDGALQMDHPVACMIEPRSEGVETSLSENLHRVAMNPADEFEAFRTIIDQQGGASAESIAYCAKRFGVTEAHVKGRLRLAGLSVTVLAALRTGDITLGSALAYASVDNPDLQAKVFAQQAKSKYQPHDPRTVRSAMQEKTYCVEDPLVKFIGFDAYKGRGGRTDIDLFTTDATERLIDTALVEDMVREAFDAQKAKLAKKLGLDSLVYAASCYTAKAPDGFKSVWLGYDQADRKAKLKTLKGEHGTVYGSAYIEDDGKLAIGNHAFVLHVEEPETERPPAKSEEDWAAERAERAREEHILLEAIRIAIPKCEGTSWEGRVFLPQALSWVRYDETTDSNLIVEVKISVPVADIEASRDAAVIAYDAAVARREAEREEKARCDAEMAAANAERDKALLASPPAVVEIEEYDSLLFRWDDGSYADVREADGQDEHEFDCAFACLEELLDQSTVARTWATIEAYEADRTEWAEDTEVAEEPVAA
jgi:ParB family transcriptional regulator, chromosome partitioning protein